MVDYRVEVEDPNAHLFRVTLTLPRPAPVQEFSLPVWAPGSYLVRDFVRHLSGLSAHQAGQPRDPVSIGKSRWRVEAQGTEPLVLSWSVYAFDPSVRGAFLDADRGFFNGSSLFLCAEGRSAEPHRLQLANLPAGWQVATSMAATTGGHFEAADYAELIDHPFELGRFWRGGFEIGGVPHEMAVAGAWPGFDGERLLADTRRICETLVRFWHPRGAPPFGRYLFLLQARDDGYGGLEHRDSCALVCARRDLPRTGDSALDRSEGAVGLLALICHEYFHAWSVKRLQPAAFLALDLERENPERLLWFFEGFTAYYDELLLCRAGLIDAACCLRLLGKTVNTLLGTPGRRVQSVAQASFDAWTRSYRADENTPNVTVSYYTKGALLALCCDLRLRERGQGRSLDDVMRRLWRRHRDGGVAEADILAAISQVAGIPMRDELIAWVHGTVELPLQALLERAGVRWSEEPLPLAGRLGLRLSESAFTGVQVRQVLRGSAAERAGIATGDELLALDGWRLRRLEDARGWWAGAGAGPGTQPGELLLSRDGRICRVLLEAAPPEPASTVTLTLAATPSAEAAAIRRSWLGA